MSDFSILDASAILAYLQNEKGSDVLDAAFDCGPCRVTTVNYCEVMSKLFEKGMPADEARAAVDDLGLTLIDFDAQLAREAAALRPRTIPIGASLGDRACLSLALHATQTEPQATPTVFTAEFAWTKLKWPFKIVLIRPPKADLRA